jgi:hypothetical protein
MIPEMPCRIASMKFLFAYLLLLSPAVLAAQGFSCPAGQADVMKYFVMSEARRDSRFLQGDPNPIYTQVFPDTDFPAQGYWFWLKGPKAHGFDVKSFDEKYVYMRSTELTWKDNTSFKRFERDLPIAARCAPEGESGPEIKVADTKFVYFSGCRPYKSSSLGTAVNNIDAPQKMDVGGNIGPAWTRVLHYRYNCDKNYHNCRDEEQFYLADGFGLWKWQHYKNESLVKSALINEMELGKAGATLPCSNSYQ